MDSSPIEKFKFGRTTQTKPSTVKFDNEMLKNIPKLTLPKFTTPCKRKENFPVKIIKKFDNYSSKVVLALSDEILELDQKFIENGVFFHKEKTHENSLLSLKINFKNVKNKTLDFGTNKTNGETTLAAEELKEFYLERIEEIEENEATGKIETESKYAEGQLDGTLDIPNFQEIEISNIKNFIKENENFEIDDLMKIKSPKKVVESVSGKSIIDDNFEVEVYKMSFLDSIGEEEKKEGEYYSSTKRDKNYASYVTETIKIEEENPKIVVEENKEIQEDELKVKNEIVEE